MVASLKLFFINPKLALAFCLVGRAFDVATTWMALVHGRAAEAKSGAAQIIHSLGPSAGLAFCEFAITTPVIFIGYMLSKRIVFSRRPVSRDDPLAQGFPPEIALLYFVGVISFVIGAHNFSFLQ